MFYPAGFMDVIQIDAWIDSDRLGKDIGLKVSLLDSTKLDNMSNRKRFNGATRSKTRVTRGFMDRLRPVILNLSMFDGFTLRE